jgi:hypothetical protein
MAPLFQETATLTEPSSSRSTSVMTSAGPAPISISLARYDVTSSSRLDSVHSPGRMRVEISTGSG